MEDPGSLGTWTLCPKFQGLKNFHRSQFIVSVSCFKLCNVSVKKWDLIQCWDKIQKRETIIINANSAESITTEGLFSSNWPEKCLETENYCVYFSTGISSITIKLQGLSWSLDLNQPSFKFHTVPFLPSNSHVNVTRGRQCKSKLHLIFQNK